MPAIKCLVGWLRECTYGGSLTARPTLIVILLACFFAGGMRKVGTIGFGFPLKMTFKSVING